MIHWETTPEQEAAQAVKHLDIVRESGAPFFEVPVRPPTRIGTDIRLGYHIGAYRVSVGVHYRQFAGRRGVTTHMDVQRIELELAEKIAEARKMIAAAWNQDFHSLLSEDMADE